jgi:hypothetical protein
MGLFPSLLSSGSYSYVIILGSMIAFNPPSVADGYLEATGGA